MSKGSPLIFRFLLIVFLAGTQLPASSTEALVLSGPSGLPAKKMPKPRADRPQKSNPAYEQKTALDFLEDLKSRQDFDRLARMYNKGKFYKLPHLMFAADRSTKKVYWIASRKYDYHQDFIWAQKLSNDNAAAFYQHNYLDQDRRFLLGTLAYYPELDLFSFEFWDGDLLNPSLLKDAYDILTPHFFTKLSFKPNSLLHERVWKELANPGSPLSRPAETLPETRPAEDLFPIVRASQINQNKDYQPIQLGTAVGKLRFLKTLTADTILHRDEIIVFEESPFQLTPVAGILTSEPSSPLSHLSMLAAGWNVPYAFLDHANARFSNLEGKYVRLKVEENSFEIVEATDQEIKTLREKLKIRSVLLTPRVNLEFKEIEDLKNQRAVDADKFGSKSANLGELIAMRSNLFRTPPGFTVPFYFYREFLKQNGLDTLIEKTLKQDLFKTDPNYRKQALLEIRKKIQNGKLDADFEKKLLEKTHATLPEKGLFVRSSTNSEDLPNFSGAGLYATVPNVKTEQELVLALKTVWASLWNFEAYEARETFGLNHLGVFPAVIIQEAMAADSAGVAITADPFSGPSKDKSSSEVVLINAKKGLGIKVVEGKKQPEQLIYRKLSNSIQLLSQSEETSALEFSPKGGLVEIPIGDKKTVLSENQAWKIVWASLAIQNHFGKKPQDIEWLFFEDELFIVQTRPYNGLLK